MKVRNVLVFSRDMLVQEYGASIVGHTIECGAWDSDHEGTLFFTVYRPLPFWIIVGEVERRSDVVRIKYNTVGKMLMFEYTADFYHGDVATLPNIERRIKRSWWDRFLKKRVDNPHDVW